MPISGGEAESKVGLGGDSCGGQLAASLAHDIPGLAFQVSIVFFFSL
jgi:acetyl esterase/lipase